jgi:arylsulfatase A-like enzyme
MTPPLRLLFILLLSTFCIAHSSFAAPRPNILVIFTDDLDFEEVGALAKYSDAALAGKPSAPSRKPVLTPNLDRLVSESLVFTQFHVASVVCTPSRYALLTGQYGSRSASLRKKHPVTGAANVEFNTDIEPGQWHLARGLKDAGYTTGIVGKWHNADKVHGDFVIRPPICDYTGRENGPQDPALPENARRVRTAYDNAIRHLTRDIGWDHAGSIYIGNANELGLPKPLWEVEHNMEWFTAGAVKFLEAQEAGDKPFFLYFAPNIPHGGGRRFLDADPRATPEGLVDWHLGVQPSREDVLRRVKAAGGDPNSAWATWLDDGIGVILKKLTDLGLAENTVVLFSSDQQSRGKWTCYEGARVPLTVRWPGKVQPGTRNDTSLNSIDFAPTLLDIASAKPPAPEQAIVDGRSFASAFTGGSVSERPVLIEMGYGRALISGGWKYIAIRHPEKVEAKAKATGQQPDFLGRFIGKNAADLKRWPSYSDRDQLFDLRADPLEQTNLATDPQHTAKLAEMRALLKATLAPLPHVFGEFKTPTTP